MKLTFLGIVCIIIIVILIFKHRGKVYVLPTLPLFMLTLSYYRFWGHYDKIEIPLELNLLILSSFLITIYAYSIGKRMKFTPLDNLYYTLSDLNIKVNDSSFIISKKSLRTFLYIYLSHTVVLTCG